MSKKTLVVMAAGLGSRYGGGLVALGLDPTVQLGGRVDVIGGNWRIGGDRKYFVAEACEYHSSFLFMHPTVALITNIQEDHLDYYKDIDDIQNAFGRFLALLPDNGIAVGCGDDPRIRTLFAGLKCRCVTYGTGEGCDYTAKDIRYTYTGSPVFGGPGRI